VQVERIFEDGKHAARASHLDILGIFDFRLGRFQHAPLRCARCGFFSQRIQRCRSPRRASGLDLGQELTHRALAPALDPGCNRIRRRDSRHCCSGDPAQRHAIQARHCALEFRKPPQSTSQGCCILEPTEPEIEPFAAVVVPLSIAECLPRFTLEQSERCVRDAADGMESRPMLAE
jgi:hypothetical protein